MDDYEYFTVFCQIPFEMVTCSSMGKEEFIEFMEYKKNEMRNELIGKHVAPHADKNTVLMRLRYFDDISSVIDDLFDNDPDVVRTTIAKHLYNYNREYFEICYKLSMKVI